MPHPRQDVGDRVVNKVNKIFHSRHIKSQSSENQ